ncbi:PAS domain S-box protein [Thermodesulfobacteriota bacterium]
MTGKPTYEEMEQKVKALEKEVAKEKEEKRTLLKREARLKAMLTASPVGICLVVNHRLDWVNAALCRMVGYEGDFLLGKSVTALYPDREAYEQVEKELSANVAKSDVGQIKTQWVHKDGTLFDCIVRASLLEQADPSKGAIMVAIDSLESVSLEGSIGESRKIEELSALARRISHDFNNLLMGIQGRASMMLLDADSSHPHFEHLKGIEGNVQSAANLTGELSNFAKSIV